MSNRHESHTATAVAATGAHRGPEEPSTTAGARNASEALHGPTEPREEASTVDGHAPTRPWTPSTPTTIVMKRACNGRGQRLGDITDQEMACGINGLPLPDVRRECPKCAPTAPEPRCRPVSTVDGDEACLDQDCDHDTVLGSDYCGEVTEHTFCLTHSTIDRDGTITHAQPWPCQHTAVTA